MCENRIMPQTQRVCDKNAIEHTCVNGGLLYTRYIAQEFNQQNEKKALKCARYCACVLWL